MIFEVNDDDDDYDDDDDDVKSRDTNFKQNRTKTSR